MSRLKDLETQMDTLVEIEKMLSDNRVDEALEFIKEKMDNAKSIISSKKEIAIFLNVLTKIKELLLSDKIGEAINFINEEIEGIGFAIDNEVEAMILQAEGDYENMMSEQPKESKMGEEV